MSERVAFRLPLPWVVVTCLVTGSRLPLISQDPTRQSRSVLDVRAARVAIRPWDH